MFHSAYIYPLRHKTSSLTILVGSSAYLELAPGVYAHLPSKLQVHILLFLFPPIGAGTLTCSKPFFFSSLNHCPRHPYWKLVQRQNIDIIPLSKLALSDFSEAPLDLRFGFIKCDNQPCFSHMLMYTTSYPSINLEYYLVLHYWCA